VHGPEAPLGQAAGERFEVSGGDGRVRDDERPLRSRKLRQVGSGLLEEAGRDRYVVVTAPDRDLHALQRRSSFSIAAATSSTEPLASTTCAANSR
jgi:hypothetical protein